jgi:DNA-binding CsgD family transcriptional regulator
MARLGHSELKAFSEALLELYSPGPHADLPARLFKVLSRCISVDFFAYHEVANDYQNERLVIYPEYGLDIKVFEAYLYQHPAWNAVVKDRLESPVKISDFASLSQWQRTDLYNHIFRSRDQNYQLGFITLDHQPQLGIALNRSAPDFSEEDRQILGLFKPHLALALNASRLFSHLSEATEAGGQGYLVTDSAGKIRFGTNKAIRWLQEYFGSSASLPRQLQDWLKRRATRPFDTNGLALGLKEFSIQLGPKRLTVQSISSVQGPEHRLVLREKAEQLDPEPLQQLGLTKREAEVLLWVSQGKGNGEISQILGTRARTITKHVERIFDKLCVENRISAANVAIECFRQPAL